MHFQAALECVREVSVSREDIMPRMRSYLSRAGHPTLLSGVSAHILEQARAVYEESLLLASPTALMADFQSGAIGADILPPSLVGAKAYSIMLFSIGYEISGRIESYFEMGEPLKAVLADAWGSESVETLAVNVDRRLRKARGEGSIRFAPGYGDFDIRNNVNWLKLMREKSAFDIPVKSDELTGILTPVKSILCMIGWKEWH